MKQVISNKGERTMRTVCRAALMIAAVVFLLPLSARSEIKEGSAEVGLFVGYNFFQSSQNLKNRPEIGGRLSYNFTKHFGVEGALEFIRSHVNDRTLTGVVKGQFRSPMDSVHVNFYHVDLLYHFMPDSRFTPFIVAGYGVAHYSPKIANKDMSAFNVGVGAKYWVTDNTAVRLDLRDNMVSEIFKEPYRNIGATVGITYAFGGKAKPAPVAVVKPAPEPVAVATPAPAPVVVAKPAPEPEPVVVERRPVPEPVAAPTPEPEPEPVVAAPTPAPAPVAVATPAPEIEEPVVIIVAEPKVEEKVIALNSQPKIIEEKVIVFALEDIHFNFDSSTLTKEAQEILKRNIQILNENPKAKIRIAGYTSASGTDEYNQKLSERRANAVKDYLIKEKVATPDRLFVIGYGETKPAEYEAAPKSVYSEAAKANMRVLFEIIVK